MVRRLRIAVVADGPTELPALLGRARARAQIRLFRDLYAEAEALRRYQPAVVFVVLGEMEPQDEGALRMLRAWMPDTGLVLAGESPDLGLQAIATPLHAAVLPAEPSVEQLDTALQDAETNANGDVTASLIDLVGGLSDEINNPLMVTAGYVQLLESRLAELDQDHAALADLVQQIKAGVARVSATMDKVALLTRAAEAAAPEVVVDLAPLVASALEQRQATAGDEPDLRLATPLPESVAVLGHEALLQAMVGQLCACGVGLLAPGGIAHVALLREGVECVLELRLSSTTVPSWRLARTFEPYYLSRLLRGTAEGLGLFLVQLVAHGHGGHARAEWATDGGAALRVTLPAAKTD